MGEFDLIQKYFACHAHAHPDVALGIGDDCALLHPPQGMQLVLSTDMLVEGVHFLSSVDAAALGHKALAVNLSDLAACGAQPVAFSLALALPAMDEPWLEAFSHGLFTLAHAHRCTLIGGDTTRGPLTLCITIYGYVPAGEAILRSGAQVGDDIYVSGEQGVTVGEAFMALQALRSNLTLPPSTLRHVRNRMERPTARVALGQALRGIATSCIDVSDGLLGDLGHILDRSGVGARVETAWLDVLDASCALSAIAPGTARMGYAYAGGDDYELLFTAAVSQRAAVQNAARAARVSATRIGVITQERGCVVLDAAGKPMAHGLQGFDHFAS